jgi:hypothetical protein
MQALLRRAVHVPLRHLLVASGMLVVVSGGFWIWSLSLPVDYVSSSLLSYETPHHFLAVGLPPDADAPTIRIAQSVLSPATLAKLADQVHFNADSESIDDRPKNQNAAVAKLDNFRSHFDLSQPAPGLLQVSYRGRDQKQVEASTNAVASTLSAWVPQAPVAPSPAADPNARVLPSALIAVAPSVAPAIAAPVSASEDSAPPTAAQKRKAAELRRRADVLDENVATLALQQQGIEGRIQKLLTEKKGLEHPAGSTSSSTDKDPSIVSARQQVERQLATARKRLKELSQSYADDFPDVQAIKDRVTILEQRLAALPPVPAAHPAPDAASRVNQPRLAAIAKSLAPLRALRATVDTELEEKRKDVQNLRAQAVASLHSQTASTQVAIVPPPVVPAPAMVANHIDPAPAPADTLTVKDAAQHPVWLGHFTVLSWGEKPHPVEDDSRQMLMWIGLAAALLIAAAYLALAGWYFRPVTHLASLQEGLPSDVKYLGAISGGPLMENLS